MAANDFIGIDIKGVNELNAKLTKLPQAVGEAATRAAADEVVKVMRVEPPPRYVSRKSIYGVPFQSDKQRRYFFAALHDGRIKVPYTRTGGLKNAWTIIGQGLNEMVVNRSPHAGMVMGDDEQSRQFKLIGWKRVGVRLKESSAKLLKVMNAAADKAIRKLGLK